MRLVGLALFAAAGMLSSLARRISARGVRLRGVGRSLSQAPALVRNGLDLRSTELSLSDIGGYDRNVNSVFSESLGTVKGVGKKTLEVYNPVGVNSLGSLLLHFPTNVIDRRKRVALSEEYIGSVVTVEAVVDHVKEGPRGAPYTVTCTDLQNSRFGLTFFLGKTAGAQYAWIPYSKVLQPGARVVISGKLGMSSFTNRFEMINPDLVLDASSIGELEDGLVAEPVYGLTAGLTGAKLRGMVKNVLNLAGNADIFEKDWLSASVKEKYGWTTLKEAFERAYECGYRIETHNTKPRIPHAFEAEAQRIYVFIA